MSSSLVLNCQEDPSTKTKVITWNSMCVLTDDNNDKYDHILLSYKTWWKERFVQLPILCRVIARFVLYISHSETYSPGIWKKL